MPTPEDLQGLARRHRTTRHLLATGSVAIASERASGFHACGLPVGSERRAPDGLIGPVVIAHDGAGGLSSGAV